MKTGKVSETALRVAVSLVTLNQQPGWSARLPEGLAELTERLVLAAGVFGFGPLTMRLSKKQWAYTFGQSLIPGLHEWFGERKIFMNDQVLATIEAGATQVLVLGAGFDTLCLRLAPRLPEVRFFEVDHPATSSAKAKGVAQQGQPENMTLIAADLSDVPLSKVMTGCDAWDSDAHSVVVAEGLLMFLTRDHVAGLFRETATCTAPGSRLAFSHLIDLGRHRIWHRIVNAKLKQIGEPHLSASKTADLQEYIGPAWSVIATREAESERHLEGIAVAESIRGSSRFR